MSDSAKPKGRVLIVIRQFFPLAAGAETQALRQAQSYIAMGYSARVLTARHDPALALEEVIDGVPVTRLPAPRTRFIGSIVYLLRLAFYLTWHKKQYDAVLAFHLKQSAAIAAVFGRLLGKRVVISDQAAGKFGDIEALRQAWFGGAVFSLCRLARLFVSGSRDITDELAAAGIPKVRIRFIPNGIPFASFAKMPDKASVRAALGIAPDAFVVVNVGRHTAQKDLKTLLAGWRDFAPKHANALLVLVGDGDERAMLERLVVDQLLTSSVRFEGWRSNVADYLAAADVFASSSISEGTHIALGEAMASGLPVIATPVGGARDFLSGGQNGFVIPVGGSTALARVLEELSRDAAGRLKMGQAARRTAETELGQEETAWKHLEALFDPIDSIGLPRPLRITHLIATLDRGGSEQQMAQLAAGLDRQRYDVRVLCLTRGGPVEEILDKAGIPVGIFGKKGKFGIVTLARLVKELYSDRPDCLHTWLFTSNLYGRLAAPFARVPHVVVSERSTDPWKGRIHRVVDRMLLRSTDLVVANSGAVSASLAAHGIPRERVRVIPNCVDTERFAPRDKAEARNALGLAAAWSYVGYIGRLAFEKRPEVFIDAAKEILTTTPQAKAVLFGTGPMEADLRNRAGVHSNRIIFHGDCPGIELAHSALDCLVLTSSWEGFPNVVLEAMASARPVVAVRMPATEEIIEDGVTGLLVEDNAHAVAIAIAALLHDPAEAEAMGKRARERVLSVYTVPEMVASYDALYYEVTGTVRREATT